MSVDQKPKRRVDLVALVAGLVFVLFSVVSATVGILDIPSFDGAPLWLLLIGAGALLLIGELRGRRNNKPDAVVPADSPEQTAWEQDPYR